LDWKYSDLKLIDAADAVEPDQDLIAAYSRIDDHNLQLRMDFLELGKYLGKDIYIPIDTNPGGDTQILSDDKSRLVSDIKWDYLIKMTKTAGIELVDNHYKILNASQLYVVYDRDQDRIVIGVTSSNLPTISGQTKFQVIITSPGTSKIADKSKLFSIDTPSPARVKVLFAFWKTFSSDTPAQTLRSWEGAHTGPISSRHGLKYLLDVAERTDATVFLLDLLTPENISALDYLNAIPQIRKLSDRGILGLPDIYMYEEVGKSQTSLATTYDIDTRYHQGVYPDWIINNDLNNIDMRSNSNFYLLLNNVDYKYNGKIDFGDNDYAQYTRNQFDCDLLPTNQVSDIPTGNLSLNCKRLFLSSAYVRSPSPLVLGGDFTKSILGDPLISTEVFSYIAAHPWIQVVTIQDLATSGDLLSGIPLPAQDSLTTKEHDVEQSVVATDDRSSTIQTEVYTALLKSPRNQLTDLAWQVYDSLLEPGSPELVSLRENYIGQIGEILAAANWAKAPTNIHSCQLDLDYDDVNECILANDHIFTVIEPDGGYIPFVFSTDDHGIHQVIGPTWEFMTGFSDPSSWDIGLGVRADSDQILGALQDNFNNWNSYFINIEDEVIRLYDVDMAMRKSVYIYPDKIRIDILSTEPSQITPYIPLVIDPWHRFTPHWGDSYTGAEDSSGFRWGIIHGEMVGIFSTPPVTSFTFNATRKALAFPEDPNFDYSRGHYLPYPMALVELTSPDNISVDIVLNP
jgi:hypothetical protein